MMTFPFFGELQFVDNVDFKFSVGMKETFQNIIVLHEVGNLSFSWTSLKLIVNITAIFWIVLLCFYR